MTSPISTVVRIAVLLAAVVVLAACGSNSPGLAASAPTSQVTSPTASSTSLTTPDASSSQPPSADRAYAQLTSAQLIKALPALDEMPAGYTAEEPDTSDTNETFCNYMQPNHENSYASITYDGTSTSAIAVSVRQYNSVDDASAQQVALAKAMQTCSSMTSSGTTLKVAQMSAPKLGYRTVGVALSSQGYTIAELFIQVGPAVLQVGEAGLGGADVTKVTGLAKKAIAKYQDAAMN
jgi:hypothetical protein